MDKTSKKIPIQIVSVFFLCTLCAVFSTLCLHSIAVSGLQRNAFWLSWLISGLFVVASVCCTFWIIRRKSVHVKTFFAVLLFILFCLILWWILQITGFFAVVNNKESLQNYLERAGIWMPIFYILLQYLQVVILPIPGIVSTAAGVALFGPFFTSVYSFVGIVLGSLTAFFIGRKLGGKAVEWLLGEETLEKWQKKFRGKDNVVLTCAFLLPLFPDDVLCFIAGLSSMSTPYFIVMIIISRLLGIAATCYSVNFIPFNTWWGITVWGIILVGLIVGFTLLYKNFNRIQLWITEKFSIHKENWQKNRRK